MTIHNTSVEEAEHKDVQITIATASNFYFPLQALIEASEYWSEQNIRIVSGSSGTLFAQAKAGAPFDLFLSADTQRPARLHADGISSAPITYAIGKLAIWPVPSNYQNSVIDADGLKSLMQIDGKIAIANPKTAPFGAAAQMAFQSAKLTSVVQPKLVFGNNVAQAFQFVDSGNATLGVIAESPLIQAQSVFAENAENYKNYGLIDDKLYKPLEQQGVILKRASAEKQAQAMAFMNFLLNTNSQKRLAELGYKPMLK